VCGWLFASTVCEEDDPLLYVAMGDEFRRADQVERVLDGSENGFSFISREDLLGSFVLYWVSFTSVIIL
jgi:hypothetical protein